MLLNGSVVYDTYWSFAAERQMMLFRRLRNDMVLTTDPILGQYRFTNAYRASDRVSQYLLAHVIPKSEWTAEDLFFRVLLFKIFNKIETWESIVALCGEPHWGDVSISGLNRVLQSLQAGQTIYSAAYIMPSPALGGSSKAENHLSLLWKLMRDELPKRWLATDGLGDLYRLLLDVPSFGPFLAFQYAIDLNYTDFIAHDEAAFVVAGPGARGGIAKCFPESPISVEDTIMSVTENQEAEFAARGIAFPSLYGRRLQPIDCQNLFCEVDKYARIAHPEFSNGRTRIKQNYRYGFRPMEPFVFPASWQLDVASPPTAVPNAFACDLISANR